MSDKDELSKLLAELINIGKKIILQLWTRFDNLISRLIPNKTMRLIVVIVGISFVFGYSLGQVGNGGSNKAKGLDGFNLLNSFFAPVIYVPGEDDSGSFILSDFEEEKGLEPWAVRSAKVERVRSHVHEGEYAAKITYFRGQESASFYIDDYFESRKGLRNWSQYKAFSFYIYNPKNLDERLIIQIKDKDGRRFKYNAKIPAAKGQEFSILTERLAASLNIKEIAAVQFFVWKPGSDKEFYIDSVKLVPSNLEVMGESKSFQMEFKNRAINPMDYNFKLDKSRWLVRGENGVVRIPFYVKNETDYACQQCPVEGGIPFPKGELTSLDNLQLIDVRNTKIAFQPRVLGKWADGSIKWVGLHFEVALPATEGIGLYLEYGPNVARLDFKGRLEIQDLKEGYIVDTGTLQVKLSKRKFYLFEKVLLDINNNDVFEDNEMIVEKAPLVITFRGEEYRADLDDETFKLIVEEKGPLRTVIKGTGWFQNNANKRFCQVIVRYYFYQGKNYLKVAHTLIYTGYPANTHYDRYKNLDLPDNEAIEQYGVRLPHFINESGTRIFVGNESPNKQQHFLLADKLNLLQDSWLQTNLKYNDSAILSEGPASGWVNISNSKFGMSIGVRHFRENFPKAFNIDRDNVTIDLWPDEVDSLDLSTTVNASGPDARARGSAFGLAKSHDLLFYFHTGNQLEAKNTEYMNAFMEPLMLRNNPYWVRATGAVGLLSPVGQNNQPEEDMLERLFGWAARQIHEYKWYGLLDFGDTRTWLRKEDESGWYGELGWYPVGRWGWYNTEGVGTYTGALLQYLRTGHYKYFEFGENAVRHAMDVDTVHFNTIKHDSRLKSLNDEMSQVGSMHRHNGDHWGGRNEESTHTSVVGILLYYYLSGNERAFDVANEIGSFYLKEPFTYSGHPDIAPHRGLANALWGDVLLYELTGDVRYKKAADKIIQIYLNGQNDDGSFYQFYNPLDGSWNGEKQALYMHDYALGAFIAYYELTQDVEVRDMLLRMQDYLGARPQAMHGNAFAYYLTKDSKYIANIDRGITELLNHSKKSADSIWDGMIYDKLIYHRPNTYLYTVPFALNVADEPKAQAR